MADVRRELAVEREREAWRLRLQGWTQQQIADHLDVEQSSVSYALKRIERKLAEEFKAEAEEVKARQTEQLQMVFASAWKQWERSCEDAEKETVVTGRVKATDTGILMQLPDQTTRTVEGQSGNPGLLAQAMKALADIRGVWGLDAPKKQESKHSFEGMTDAELDAFIAAAESALVERSEGGEVTSEATAE